MTVMIGVDPHKGSHTAVAVDKEERSLAELRVRSGPKQLERLLQWAEQFPDRRWAVENATGLGYLLAQQLVAAGERVLDVQPKLAARVRLLATESTNKNDPHDARSVAIAALRSPTPKEVGVEDHAAVMKLWARRHQNLSSTRTQIACRLHAVLCDLVAGGIPDEIYAQKAVSLLARVEPDSAVAAARVQLAHELLDDLRRVDNQIKESRKPRAGRRRVRHHDHQHLRRRTSGGRDRRRRHRRHRSLPDPRSVRCLQRHRPHRGVLRRPQDLAALPPREPHRQPPHPHGRRHPGPPPAQSRARLLRPQDRPRQDATRGATRPQATDQRRPLGSHGRRLPPPDRSHGSPAQGGLGRATGERLCRQRGRLTPRDTGSSAKPLPNPRQGYDHQDDVATHDAENASEDPKNYLMTHKEDSFGVRGLF